MARRAAVAAVDGGNLQSRIVSQLNKDKDIAGVLKTGDTPLLSLTPYYISTQSAAVDYMIGRPGIPGSKLTTIFGREGSGKSTLAQHLLAETQRIGGIGVLADSEQRFDRKRGELMGINTNDLVYIDGATMEQTFSAIEKIILKIRDEDTDIPVTIVYDSLAGSIPEKRMEAEVGDSLPGRAAAVVSQELPRLKLKISNAKVALVIVNQLRSRINMGGDPRSASYRERMKVMGKEQTMLAEWPLIYESALMLFVNSIAQTGEDKDHPTGIRSRITNRKCGIAPREGWKSEIDIDYMKGFDINGSKFELLEDLGVINGGAAGWYYVGEDTEHKFRRGDFPKILEAHPELDEMVRNAPTLWESGYDGSQIITNDTGSGASSGESEEEFVFAD